MGAAGWERCMRLGDFSLGVEMNRLRIAHDVIIQFPLHAGVPRQAEAADRCLKVRGELVGHQIGRRRQTGDGGVPLCAALREVGESDMEEAGKLGPQFLQRRSLAPSKALRVPSVRM